MSRPSVAGYTGDGGPAAQARLSGPTALAVDRAGDLFIADAGNQRVREVRALRGIISTIAGSGEKGYGGDGGPALQARLADPAGLALDGTGDLYIADHDNNRVRIFSGIAATRSALPSDPVPASTGGGAGVIYFPQSQHTLAGAFRQYFVANGGLPIFGLPLSEPFHESGQLVQYFERARLVFAGGKVSPSPLGRELTANRHIPPVPCCGVPRSRWFAESRQTLAEPFLAFWLTHRGSVVFGPPISGQVREGNGDGTGRIYLVQYFTNARLEYHPELGIAYRVTVGQLGREALQRRGWI